MYSFWQKKHNIILVLLQAYAIGYNYMRMWVLNGNAADS